MIPGLLERGRREILNFLSTYCGPGVTLLQIYMSEPLLEGWTLGLSLTVEGVKAQRGKYVGQPHAIFKLGSGI